ncbi:hypothetical protein E9993_10670 [Labilibacter sediminis]|nr:hypothetical protein E9993_10670 [Labilibacter sediminis]
MEIRRFKILLVPVFVMLMMFSSFAFMIYFGFKSYEELAKLMVVGKLLSVSVKSILEFSLYYFFVRWLNKKLPWNKNWVIRILVDACIVLLLSFTGISIILYIENQGLLPMGHVVRNNEFVYVIPLVMNSFYLVLVEMIMAVEIKNKLAIKLTQLEKQQIDAKYQALKSQIDHHFLFNNLSVLSSIIYEDVEKADVFIQKLSKVYRYVLSINKRDLVSVEEEIEFISCYLDLYKYRFEESFNYKIDIQSDKLACLIPPLTLQVLVENTCKHNIVSRHQPLDVTIQSVDEGIEVKNNIQLRESNVDSTGTGLNNLKEKYSLLGAKEPVVSQENGFYSVFVSLIPKNDG